jgi:hypothetical protein
VRAHRIQVLLSPAAMIHQANLARACGLDAIPDLIAIPLVDPRRACRCWGCYDGVPWRRDPVVI